MGRFLNLRTLTLLGAAVAGLLTIILLTRYISLRESQISARLAQEGLTHVMLAKRDIPAARTITSVDVERTTWPKKALPKDAFHDLKSLKDRVAARKIIAGEPVLEGHLASKGSGTGLAAIIPKGKRAMAVRVNEIVGVAGFIKPGDLVDVIVTLEPDEETGIVTKTVLQRVPVIAVGQEISREGGKPKRVTAVTLMVNPADAEKLALASRNDIQLAMRNTLDSVRVSTVGATPVRLVGLPPKPEKEEEPPPEPKEEEGPPPVMVEVIRGATRGMEKF
ncbi:Flp pilus assembly protein CpaB [Nitrospinae bacterium AH_259_B05_G02_I21]|nr:Flp pilus assembly protein CpaB [Nitrospinae bacterium AH_259_B05_G02_I21]